MTGIAWESIAISLGYPDPPAMWKKLYETEGLSIAKLARRFGVSAGTVRAELQRSNIKLRLRGGTNYQKVDLTPEMEAEIEAHGIAFVAKKYSVDKTTLYKKFYKRGKRFRTPAPEQSVEQPSPDTPDSEDGSDPHRNR